MCSDRLKDNGVRGVRLSAQASKDDSRYATGRPDRKAQLLMDVDLMVASVLAYLLENLPSMLLTTRTTHSDGASRMSKAIGMKLKPGSGVAALPTIDRLSQLER